MRRRSIITFVAIYALVAGVGYFAADRNNDVPAKPANDADATDSFIVESDSQDAAVSAVR